MRAIGLVLLGLVAVGVVLFFGTKDDAPVSASGLADRMADAIENHSLGDAEDLLCGSNDVLTKSMHSLNGVGVTAVVGNLVVESDKATATVRVVRKSDEKPVTMIVQMSLHSGTWCVD
jgi:hypothetical protein